MLDHPVLNLLLAGCPIFAIRANVAPVAQRQQNPPVDKLLETALARPLFSSTRRPPQSTTDDHLEDTELSDKRLTGIVIAPGHHIAVFGVRDSRPLILAEGEIVSGWWIETIGSIEVSLSGPGGSKTLRPTPDPSLAQPPGAVPAVPGAQPAVMPSSRPSRVGPRR